MTSELAVNAINDRDPFTLTLPARRTVNQLAGEDKFERMGKWLELFMGTAKVAQHLARTAFVPDAMRGQPEDIAAAMMKGLELGIDPLDALSNIHVVKGKVGFSAEFMRRRIIEAGHEIEFVETTDDRCRIRGRRAGAQEWQTVTFTADQARKAKIDLGNYPGDKLVARASSRLCRRVFPDVLAGTTIIEDIIDDTVGDVDDAVAVAVGGRAVQRKPRQRKESAPTTPTPMPTDIVEPVSDLDEFPTASGHGGGKDASQGVKPSSDATQESDSHDQNTPDQPPTAPMNRKMHALFRDADLTDRDDRLTVTSMILGYKIDTSANLTKSEASRLIDKLEEWQQNGELSDMINEILNQAVLAAENQKGETNE